MVSQNYFVPYYVPMWCDSYQSCDHHSNNCPYQVLDIFCVNLDVMMNDVTNKMIRTMKDNMVSRFS